MMTQRKMSAKYLGGATALTQMTGRKPGLAVMVMGVTAGSTIGVQATKESPAKDHTSCATPANPPQLKIHFPEPSGTQITNSFTTNH